MQEARKIFADSELRVSATCVRVPVLRAHSVAVTFECERPIAADEVRCARQYAPGVRLVDDAERNYFPMPQDASGQDAILVGRIRQDVSDPSGRSITLFCRRRSAPQGRGAQRGTDRRSFVKGTSAGTCWR